MGKNKTSLEDSLKCKRCGKILTKGMEIEYSEEITEVFCHPDCAMDYYFEYMGSKPVSLEEAKELLS